MISAFSQIINKAILIKLKKHVKLFQDFDFNEIAFFLEKGEKIAIKSSTTLFKKYTIGSEFYIILNGELLVYLLNRKKEKIILNKLNTMHIIGEIGSLSRIKRTANVECTTDCTLLKFHNNIFNKIEKTNPNLSIKIYKNIISILIQDYLKPNLNELEAAKNS